MIDTLDNLRGRPRHEKKAIAAWVAIGIVVIILLIWALLFLQHVQFITSQPTQHTANASSTGLTAPTSVDGSYYSPPTQ